MLEVIYYFVVLSFLGWFVESIYSSIQASKFINRGMLYTPFCPIYGFVGTILVIIDKFYNPNIFLTFFLTVVLAIVVEYSVSYLAEKILKVHWWDYSNNMFNLHGRVCLRNSILFGLLGSTLLLVIPILNYIFLIGFKSIWVILLIVIILDALANIKNIVLIKKDIVLELGNRSFTFDIFKYHKPVSILTLFKSRRDKIKEDIKKILEYEK